MRNFFLFISIFYLNNLCCNDKAYDILIKYLPKTPVIVEAGGHNGSDTLKMIGTWPHATIYTFECNPKVFKQLQKSTARHPNIYAFELGLGDIDGEATFYLSSAVKPNETMDAQSSLFPINPKYWGGFYDIILLNETTQVKIAKLDTWAENHGVDHVDFLWLDTQGFEYNILTSAPKILSTVKAIKTEFSKVPYYKGTVCYDTYHKWLEAQGFVCIYKEDQEHGNAAYVRQELL